MTAPAGLIGQEMHAFMERLFPICRSITGPGIRETMRLIGEQIPLAITEVPTGTRVFDWTVPKEWTIRDAYVKNSKGERVIDFQKSNLHVLNYSAPIHAWMKLVELKDHLRTLPDHPDWIPYGTSYYKEQWGFCLTQNQYNSLLDDEYEVMIDSTLEPGSLTYGEYVVPGDTSDEVLFSTYVCHPSLGNDGLSGAVLTTFLAKYIAALPRQRYTYRFLFIPETIGSITWLSEHQSQLGKIRHGLVVTCVGDRGETMTYKRSRAGDQVIDQAVAKVLIDSGQPYQLIDFNPAEGGDERQFCSPGINLPIGCLMRTPYVRYPEYHTSADNLEFVTAAALADSLARYIDVQTLLDRNETYISQCQTCEPQLGRRGLYRHIGSLSQGVSMNEAAIFWVVSYSDGRHSLLDIAIKSQLPFIEIAAAADALCQVDLLTLVTT